MRLVIVTLNTDEMQHRVLEPLVSKYFGERVASEYFVTIARREAPDTIVYNHLNQPRELVKGEVVTGILS